MADAQTGNRVAFSFLQDIANRFRGRYATFSHAQEYSMQDFGRTLKEKMDYFSNNPSSEKISKVKSEIEDVKTTLRDNIGMDIFNPF
jgi:vesicle-associated membrane protein 7